MRQAYKFLLRLSLIWILLAVVWYILAGTPYGKALVAGANLLFSRNPVNDDQIHLTYVDPRIEGEIKFDLRSLEDDRRGRGNLQFSLESRRFHFNITIWIALLLATPGWKSFRFRLAYCLGGWVLLYFCQALDLFLQVENYKLQHLQTHEFLSRYQPPGTGDYLLGSLGKYSYLLGRFVAPLALWLPYAVKAFGAARSPVVDRRRRNSP